MGNKKNKGSAMSFALIIVSIAAILFSGIVGYVATQINYSLRVADSERALHVADAGIDFYKWYLAHKTDGMQMQEIIDFWDETSPYPYGVDVPYEDDFNGVGKYRLTVTPPDAGSTIITVESIGWTYDRPDLTKTIKARLRVGSWSEYVILANTDIVIEDGENVDGKVHANGGVKFDGVAHNIVSSAVSSYVDPGSGLTKDGVWTSWAGEYNTNMSSNVFLVGKKFPVPEKDFDSVTASFSQIFDAAEEINLNFSPSTKGRLIVLEGDQLDVYEVLNTQDGVVTKTHPDQLNVSLPDVGALYVDKNIWVEGNLSAGKKLVIASNNPSVSHGNIFISNDITYDDYTSGTVLGLVAKNDIEVVEGAEDDLRIDAALMAQVGRVGRSDYGDSKSHITIYGAIATNQGYGFTGYVDKDIIFDSSLIFNPPPYFPIEGIYKLDNWNAL
jgi:hypothetical protein